MKSRIKIIPTLILGVLFLFKLSPVLSQSDSLRYVFREQKDKKDSYSLTGTITDSVTNLPISRVSIYTDNKFSGTTTDDAGRYFIELEAGIHKVTFRHISMIPITYKIALYGNGVINVKMAEKRTSLDEVVITGENSQQALVKVSTGIVRMTIEDLKKLPAFLGEPDVIKGIQSMPGVTSVGEGSSGINVRGGQTDQNLILMNDAMVISSNHAMGFLSPFNPDVVQNAELYKGSLSSQYGGRASSALKIQMKRGNLEKWGLEASLGTSSNKLTLEGPIVKEKLSVLLSSRVSNANWLLRKVQNADIKNSSIQFYDIYGSIFYKINQKLQLEVNTLQTSDNFKFSNQFGYKWNVSVSSLNLKAFLNDNLSIQSMLAYGDFSNSYFDPSGPESATVTNGIKYIQGKISGLATLKKHEFILGVEGIRYTSKPETISPYDNLSLIQSRSIDKDNGSELAFFLSDDWNNEGKFALSAGLRASYYFQQGADSVFLYGENQVKDKSSITDTLIFGSSDKIKSYSGIEPRVSARITISKNQTIKLSYSRMIQYIQAISNSTGPTPIDIWQVPTVHIKPLISDNFSVGYFLNSKNTMWSYSIELFSRKTQNQLDYKDFADLFLNNTLETELVNSDARANGVEVLLKKNLGKWNGWLAYTFSRSQLKTNNEITQNRINNGDWYPSNFDKPHNATFVVTRKIAKKGLFSTNISYSSGRPISIATETYFIDNVVIPNYSDRNSYRIPNYFRLDLAITIGSILRKIDDNLVIGVYNLTSRRNAYSVFFERDRETLKMKPFKLSILGTAFPSITYSVKF